MLTFFFTLKLTLVLRIILFMIVYILKRYTMRREKVFTQIPEGYYHRRLNNGCSATCYLTDFGKVFKEYPEEYEYLRELEYLTY